MKGGGFTSILQNWSLKERLALIPFLAAVLLSVGIALWEHSQETNPDDSRPELSIAKASPPAAGPSEKAPFSPRTEMIPVSVAADKTLRDDHAGECPAFTHLHPTAQWMYDKGVVSKDDMKYMQDWDGMCHDDVTDKPIKERPKLPKYKPNPKATWA